MRLLLWTHNTKQAQQWQALLEPNYEVEYVPTLERLLTQKSDAYVIYYDVCDQNELLHTVDTLNTHFKGHKIVVLRDVPTLEEGELLLGHDIGGYGNAHMHESVLKQAVEVVCSGNVWLYPALMEHLIAKLNGINKHKELPEYFDTLTKREKEVALLAAHGQSNVMIAKELDISPNTVKLHMAAIFEKLGIKSRIALALHLN